MAVLLVNLKQLKENIMTTPSAIYGLSALAQQGIGGAGAIGIVAAGSTQATATVLTADDNAVATTAASTGVLLPIGEPGKTMTVFNGGANTLSIYPPLGGTINGGAANAAVTIATLKGADLKYFGPLTIYANLSA